MHSAATNLAGQPESNLLSQVSEWSALLFHQRPTVMIQWQQQILPFLKMKNQNVPTIVSFFVKVWLLRISLQYLCDCRANQEQNNECPATNLCRHPSSWNSHKRNHS